ncbi:MAG: hypothetical protein HZB26_21445 [Candidatus Hydrogenedentes bacterium]|nr:hypothetical protein [Candidatus Hydrogenedentota bacterium]
MRDNGVNFRMDFCGTDTIVSDYARVLTRHWKTLSSRVVDFVAGDATGDTQGHDGLGAGRKMVGSSRIFASNLGTPVVTRAIRALQGDVARDGELDSLVSQPLSYRDSEVCEDAEYCVIAAFRAAQTNAKTFLSTLDIGLRTPWETAATGVDL